MFHAVPVREEVQGFEEWNGSDPGGVQLLWRVLERKVDP